MPFLRRFTFTLIASAALFATPAGAITRYVTSISDDGSAGTLRYEMEHAAPGDNVVLTEGLAGQTITLSRPIIVMGTSSASAPASITPAGASAIWMGWWPYSPWDKSASETASAIEPMTAISTKVPVAISGNKATHLFEVRAGVAVTMEGLILKDGNNVTSDGGAIKNAGTLNLIGCTLAGHQTVKSGGAVNNQSGGKLQIENSTLSNNTATLNGGALANLGSATLYTSTLSDNTAGVGGGLYTLSPLVGYHLTVARNRAISYGGGAAIAGSIGKLTLGNSLVVGNTSASGGREIHKVAGSYSSEGQNLVGQNGEAGVYPSTLLDGVNDSTSVNFKTVDLTLNPLALTLNAETLGGVPQLCSLSVSSDAIDAGDNDIATMVGITLPAGAVVDLGAVQYEAFHQLTVTKVGSGSVTSTPALLNCGVDCAGNFPGDASVTLTATPASGYRFSAWSGVCTDFKTCVVKMDGDKAVTATFVANAGGTAALTVTKPLNGTITGTGINCGADCSETYTLNTSVTLTAKPASGYKLSAWGGACSGTAATCAVKMDGAKTVTATFTLNTVTTYSLTVTKTGTGSGTASGAGTFAAGVRVTLTATPASGSTFAGWSPSPCAASFSMPAKALTCVATFTKNVIPTTYPLTVTKKGTGSGTVSGAGSFAAGASVTLTATPASDSTFTSWSPSPCAASFSMPAKALTCTATFTKDVASGFPKMVTIPGGSFSMGSPVTEPERYDDEQQHSVTVVSFAMGKYEVTFEEYDRFADATGRAKPDDNGWGRGKRPVIDVDWNDATAYAKWVSQQTGLKYRLPTEAEWEYAARAGTTTPFWTSNCVTTTQANYYGKAGYGNPDCGANTGLVRGQTLTVGSFPANRWGLYDTMGNVWEWTCSLYVTSYSGEEQRCNDTDIVEPRVLRGGSWYNTPTKLRSATRFKSFSTFRYNNIGFRLARSF